VGLKSYAPRLYKQERQIMTTKKTPFDYALWAALPMAHTSQIEARLTMILDKTQSRRALPRRFLLLAAAAGAAILVPLAMLQLTAKAQSVSQSAQTSAANGQVQLVGVKDINIHHTDHRWWQPNGLPLLNAPYDTAISRLEKDLYQSRNVKNLTFAFRLPAIVDGEEVTFLPSGSIQCSEKVQRRENNGSVWTLDSVFPPTLSTTTIHVGIATSAWTAVAAHAPVRRGEAHVPSAYGSMVFSPIQRYPKNNWLVTVTTDQPKQGQPKQEWRVVAVDAQGRRLFPLSFDSSGTATRLRLMAYFDKSVPFRRIRQFQVVTRQYQWKEFKDVALQPSRAAAVVPAPIPGIPPAGTAATTARLHQLYGFIQTFRERNGGAFPLWSKNELVDDMTRHPADYHLPDIKAPNYNQAAQYFTSLDSRFMPGGTLPSGAALPNFIVYSLYDKRPNGTSVGTAKPAGTRDVFAFTDLYIREHPDGATGFYLVLWDDGTISRIPAARARRVPVYDNMGGSEQESVRDGFKQIAFPGQAGLSRA
jgi:hypothetical protein